MYLLAGGNVGELRLEEPLRTVTEREGAPELREQTWIQSAVNPVMYVTNHSRSSRRRDWHERHSDHYSPGGAAACQSRLLDDREWFRHVHDGVDRRLNPRLLPKLGGALALRRPPRRDPPARRPRRATARRRCPRAAAGCGCALARLRPRSRAAWPKKCGNQPAAGSTWSRGVEHVGAVPEDRLRAVAVVGVEVDDRDRWRGRRRAAPARRPPRC